MHTLWNETDRDAMLARIAAVDDDAPPQWGKMTEFRVGGVLR
jgi:hypothetical protein